MPKQPDNLLFINFDSWRLVGRYQHRNLDLADLLLISLPRIVTARISVNYNLKHRQDNSDLNCFFQLSSNV